jgi:hypothetical protein
MRNAIALAAVVPLLFVAEPVRAAEPLAGDVSPEQEIPSLITDRPTFGAAAAAVAEDYVVFEFGAEFGRDAAGEQLLLPLGLVRWGLGDGFELDLGLPSLEAGWPDDEVAQTDVGELMLAARWVVPLSDAVSVGVLPFLTLPLKGDHYDSRGVGLGARLVWSVQATDWLGVGGNFGLLFAGLGAEQSDREYLASLGLSFALTGALGTFVEVFSVIAESDSDAAPVSVDAGLTWLVTERFQLDVYAGMDVRHAPDVFFAGLGGAVLW